MPVKLANKGRPKMKAEEIEKPALKSIPPKEKTKLIGQMGTLYFREHVLNNCTLIELSEKQAVFESKEGTILVHGEFGFVMNQEIEEKPKKVEKKPMLPTTAKIKEKKSSVVAAKPSKAKVKEEIEEEIEPDEQEEVEEVEEDKFEEPDDDERDSDDESEEGEDEDEEEKEGEEFGEEDDEGESDNSDDDDNWD